MTRYWLSAFAVLLLLAPAARGDDISLIINGLSFHFPQDEYFNQKNIGYGLQYDRTRGRHRMLGGAGTFLDSYSTHAGYVHGGYTYRLADRTWSLGRWYVDLGAVLSAAHSAGYERYYGRSVLLAPLPFASLGADRLGINVMYIPRMFGAYASVITLQLKLQLL